MYVCVVRVGLWGTDGMCAQAWGFGEDGVILDIAGPERSGAGTKKDVKAKTNDPQDEKKRNKGHDRRRKMVSRDHPLCHRMSRP